MLKFTKNLSTKKFYPLLVSLLLIGLFAIAVSVIKKAGYHITYSATFSMPRGFYLVVPAKNIKRNDIVEFIPPLNVFNFIKDHCSMPKSGLVLKYVFAVPGDDVCVRDEAIWINGKKTGKVYRFYAFKKLLPQTKICGKLKKNQYLLLSVKRKHSFDGRYFGPVTQNSILGLAVPIFIVD